ncbi:hypothetical protein EP7_004934 [Isosphaeraceae bacterium EP7]
MGTLEVSQRRIDANRRNAMRSTGPKTAEGKEASRRNSLTHGLAGSGVVVAEAEANAIRERLRQWNASLRPANVFEETLVETIVVESLRIERCRAEDNLARNIRARKAEHCWGDERTAVIAREARSLAKRPAETTLELATSSPGCDWLIARWRMLGHALDTKGEWTAEQTSLALDLLGVAAELRSASSPLEAPEGLDLLEHRQALVDDQLERLLSRQEHSLDRLEDELRQATMHGLNVTDDPTLKLIRRYETASFRRMTWALGLLTRSRAEVPAPDQADTDRPAPQPTQTAPEPRAKRSHSGQPKFTDALKPEPATARPVAQNRAEIAPRPAGNRRQGRRLRLEQARRRAAEALLQTC